MKDNLVQPTRPAGGGSLRLLCAALLGGILGAAACSPSPPDTLPPDTPSTDTPRRVPPVNKPPPIGTPQRPVTKQSSVPQAADTSMRPSLPQVALPVATIPDEYRARNAVEREYTTVELAALVDEAFGQRVDSGLPVVIIFPVLDQQNAIRPDGPAFSLLAAHAATYSISNGKRLLLTPASAQRIFSAAGCWSVDNVVDNDAVRLCCMACDCPTCVVPSIRRVPDEVGQLELTVTVYTDYGALQEKETQHRISPQQLLRVPGLVAHDLLEYLDVDLSKEEVKAVMTPQLQTPADALVLTGLIDSVRRPDEKSLVDVLAQNPGCIAAWERYLETADQPSAALVRLDLVDPPLDSPALAVAIARRLADLGRPERGLMDLLELAPTHAGDPGYHKALVRCAQRIGEDQLVRKLFEIWRALDSGYRGCLGRGETLLAWAQQADRGTSANAAQTRRDRLLAARAELERAIELNGDDWIAHAHLVDVAAGLDLPPTFVEQHFARATQRRPYFRDAYRAKLEYLRRRIDRDPDAVLAFAQRCIRTGAWRQGIPQVLHEVVRDACYDPENRSMDYSKLESHELWELMTLYWEHVRASPVSAFDKDRSAKHFALWGAYGGHYVEAFDVFWHIPIYYEENYGVDEVFGGPRGYEYVGDLFDAHAGFGDYKHAAAASIALARGELDEVEPSLRRIRHAAPKGGEGIEFASWSFAFRVERMRSALAQARRLASERAIEYSPKELKVLLIGESKIAQKSSNPRWLVEGGKLIWNAGRLLNASDGGLPFGIGHVEIGGLIEWTPGIDSVDIVAHTRAPRDRIAMAYDCRHNFVSLQRNGSTLAVAELPAPPYRFRLEYGLEEDLLDPCKGVIWRVPVVDDGPSGFGIRFVAPRRGPPARVSLSDVRIELRD